MNISKKEGLLILSVCLIIIAYFILKDANWILGDDEQFLVTTAINKPSHSCYGGGRFWPLGLCDYTLLLGVPYGYTITAHLIYNILIMCSTVFVLYNFFNKINKNNYIINIFFILIIFLTSSFMLIHMNCIYAERMMFFTLILFMYFYWKSLKYQSNKHYILALFFMIYTTYLKEPMCVVSIIIALTNFLGKLTKKDKIFNCVLLINSIIYLSIFIYRLDIKKGLYHGINHFSFDRFLLIKEILASEPLLLFIFILCFIRIYFVFFRKIHSHLFIDGLLFGSVGYIFAYILLGLSSSYYFFPSIVLSCPALMYWTNTLINSNKKLGILLISSLFLSSFYSISISTYNIQDNLYHRRNDMKLINYIVDSYKQGRKIGWFTLTKLDKNWNLRVYKTFTNYLLKIQDNSFCIFNFIDNVNDIDKYDMVLYLDEQTECQKYSLLHNFKLISRILGVSIYEKTVK